MKRADGSRETENERERESKTEGPEINSIFQADELMVSSECSPCSHDPMPPNGFDGKCVDGSTCEELEEHESEFECEHDCENEREC